MFTLYFGHLNAAQVSSPKLALNQWSWGKHTSDRPQCRTDCKVHPHLWAVLLHAMATVVLTPTPDTLLLFLRMSPLYVTPGCSYPRSVSTWVRSLLQGSPPLPSPSHPPDFAPHTSWGAQRPRISVTISQAWKGTLAGASRLCQSGMRRCHHHTSQPQHWLGLMVPWRC